MGWGSAIGSIGSSLIGAGMSIYNTNSANKHAKRQAEFQRAWEEKMSNTAHQREMADLRAAGINPLLTATGGNGATTPNSAVAQTFAAQVNGDDLSNAFIGGMNADTKKKEQEQGERLIDSTINKNEVSAENETRDSLEYQKTQEKEREFLDEQIKAQALTNTVNSATSRGEIIKRQNENLTNIMKTRAEQHPAVQMANVFGNLVSSAVGLKNLFGKSAIPQTIATTSETFNKKGERVKYTETRSRKK